MATREIYWNVVGHLIMYAFVAVAMGFFVWGFVRRIRLYRLGQPDRRLDRLCERAKSVLIEAGFQRRIWHELFGGTMHFTLSWGFILLLVGTMFVFLQADLYVNVLYGWFYLLLSLVTDLFGLAALLGGVLALFRRYILRPKRLDNTWDDAVTLLIIVCVLASGFVVEALRILNTADPWAFWTPGGLAVAWLFRAAGLSAGAQLLWHRYLWWFHMLLGVGACAYLPYSKLFHVVASPLNQFLRSLKQPGALQPLDLEHSETFGVTRVEEFTWKQLFDTDACTRCGRCQDHCPAHLSDKPLSPKKLTQDLKQHLWQHGQPLAIAKRKQKAQAGAKGGAKGGAALPETPPLVGGAVAEDALWACTTCRSCEEHCPVFVETVGKVIDMRRAQVLMAGNFPAAAQRAMKNVQTNSNPWGIGWQSRADWAQGLGVRTLKAGEGADVLYWVGCAGAFDDRNKRVATSVARLLKAAGVDFAILGTAEKCCGDSARRIGDEYTYQQLAQTNVETLKSVAFKRIVTACPHCFNALKNEYPQLGGSFAVQHAVELLGDLVTAGRLRPTTVGKVGLPASATYHDSCYLGRYNGLYQKPRQVLAAVRGLRLKEMRRRGRDALCCGAGGGRMWMEETLGKRINELRTDQALATGAALVVTACPFCLTMLEDGVKARDKVETVQVLDVAEVLDRVCI